MAASLVAASLMDAATGILYAYVGVRLGARSLEGEAARAWRAFRAWWFCIVGLVGIDAARGFATAAGWTSGGAGFQAAVALHFAYVVLLCVSLWALLYYVLYLTTGRRQWFWPLAAFYAAWGVAAFAYAWTHEPVRVQAYDWYTVVEYRVPATDPLAAVMFVLLLLPQVVGALAYGLLALRADEPDARRRIAVVSLSLVAWLGWNLVGDVLQWWDVASWEVSRRVLGLAAAVAILGAYREPGVRAGVVSARRAALQERVRDLV